MKCDICGSTNSFMHVRQLINNVSSDLHLCAKCAKERGLSAVDTKIEFPLVELFAELLRPKLQEPLLESENVVCPVCGQSAQAFLKTKKAGCEECYTVFKETLLKHKKPLPQYAGMLPRKLSHFRSVLTDRMIYQSKMEEAVQNEEYEKAAILRDRLKNLESIALQQIREDS